MIINYADCDYYLREAREHGHMHSEWYISEFGLLYRSAEKCFSIMHGCTESNFLDNFNELCKEYASLTGD
jgi:hypothetical protein